MHGRQHHKIPAYDRGIEMSGQRSPAKGVVILSTMFQKKIDLQYNDTSGRLVFVRFLEELMTPKNPFEIN